MNIFICGQKSFGREVMKRLYNSKHKIVGVAPPPQQKYKDKMVGYAILKNIPIINDCDCLTSKDIPDNTDLIISAHSHWIISDKIIEKCKYGGIGFHPSLLPRHRGQDAIRWTIHMNDFVSGGTIYKLDNRCDSGNIILQEMIFVNKDWNYKDLWRELFPLGIEMIFKAVNLIEKNEQVEIPQNEEFATWEPSWERSRLKRNELLQLGR